MPEIYDYRKNNNKCVNLFLDFWRTQNYNHRIFFLDKIKTWFYHSMMYIFMIVLYLIDMMIWIQWFSSHWAFTFSINAIEHDQIWYWIIDFPIMHVSSYLFFVSLHNFILWKSIYYNQFSTMKGTTMTLSFSGNVVRYGR